MAEPTFGDFLWNVAVRGYYAAAAVFLVLTLRGKLWQKDTQEDDSYTPEAPDMTPRRIARGAIYQAQELAKSVVTIGAALSLLGSGLWFLVQDQVATTMQEMAGTPEIMVGLHDVQTGLDSLSKRVDRLEPPQAIAVFDPLRSKIDSECQPNQVCHWSYFVRRADTEYGRTCDAPRSERVFVDAAGVEYAPAQTGNSAPHRLSTRVARVDGNFVVPHGVALGVGEFFLRLTYSRCGEDHSRTVKAETMRLVTTIVEDDR